MNTAVRRITYGAVFAILGVFVWIALRGPQGVPALLEKRREIRVLEEQNANLNREIGLKQERIRKLRDSPAEQENEIRKRFHLQHAGDVTLILPDAPKAESQGTPAP